MQAFTKLTGIAAPLPMANVDTDKIIPARFLKTIKRTGLGLIAHENFGCGSSREHAPWALLDFGIRCVISPDFADIFHTNTFKNGILPIKLPREVCDQLMEDAKLGENSRITVDLEEQVVVRPNGERIPFEIDPFRKHLLLNGLDDIGQTLQHAHSIDGYEQRLRAEKPWIPAIQV
jgi:3-isopropylmalate/(R)-2-methylmalate dehydratase small subunit